MLTRDKHAYSIAAQTEVFLPHVFFRMFFLPTEAGAFPKIAGTTAVTVESNERSSHMEDPFLMGHSVHFGGEDRGRDENFHESKEQLDRTICRPPFMIFSSYISVLDLIQLVCCLVCSTLFLRVRWFNAVMSLSSFNSCRTNNFKSSSLNSEDEGPSNSNIEDEENPSIILTIFKVPRCHRWSLPRVTFSRSKIQMIRCLIHMKSSGLRRTALGDCSYM